VSGHGGVAVWRCGGVACMMVYGGVVCMMVYGGVVCMMVYGGVVCGGVVCGVCVWWWGGVERHRQHIPGAGRTPDEQRPQPPKVLTSSCTKCGAEVSAEREHRAPGTGVSTPLQARCLRAAASRNAQPGYHTLPILPFPCPLTSHAAMHRSARDSGPPRAVSSVEVIRQSKA